ncbi:hypothetical protein L1049_010286 [Liquidambar formosana]|uniref:F-box domain-containing protein n=1 Tax=Liquidambar formosana TaxID=63359 RepID=A0AAP0N7E3_LIQFO
MRMALGKKCSSLKGKRAGVNGDEGLGLGFVRYTRGLGRKRIVISNDLEVSPLHSSLRTKKRCGERMNVKSERSLLEALPQDILVRVLCGVDHDDLKQLFHVSKSIREATLIAKQWHFAYSTPSKTRAFRNSIDLGDSSEFDEIEAPNAPKQWRSYRSRVSGNKLADISVALFASDEDQWPKRQLLMDTEI